MEKNVIKEEMLKFLQVKLQEFVKAPEPIKVTLKEYDKTEVFHAITADSGTISKMDYNDYLNYEGSKPISTIEYTKETSYMGFHDLAWKELSMEQKMITLLWFNKLIAENNDKDPIMVIIDGYSENVFKYDYYDKKDIFTLVVNPFLLNDSKQYFGGFILHNLLLINVEDDMNVSLDTIKKLNNNNKFDVLTLANYLKPIQKPEYLNDFHYNIDALDDEQKKQALLFLNQPIETAFRGAFDLAKEYMLQCQEVVEVPDYMWDSYEQLTAESHDYIDNLTKIIFLNDEKEQFFNKYLKEKVDDISYYINHQEKER